MICLRKGKLHAKGIRILRLYEFPGCAEPRGVFFWVFCMFYDQKA